MQQTYPFKMTGAGTMLTKVGVKLPYDMGEEGQWLMNSLWSPASYFTAEASIPGWFGREMTTTEANNGSNPGGAFATQEADFEFMLPGNSMGPWWEVPEGLQFVTLFAASTGRGILLFEWRPVKPRQPLPVRVVNHRD